MVMKNPTFILTHLALGSRKFPKKIPIYMWPTFTHACPCVAHVHP